MEDGPFDLVHAHDWLVQDAAVALKYNFKLPVVSTVHATEYGRYNGIWTDTQRYIHLKEFSLVYQSWRTIVCTNYMRGELGRAFGCPWDKMDVIPNGIKASKKSGPILTVGRFAAASPMTTKRLSTTSGGWPTKRASSFWWKRCPRCSGSTRMPNS